MKIDISGFRLAHNALLPPQEPSVELNNSRRVQEEQSLSLFNHMKVEQDRHAECLAAATGQFSALAQPHIVGTSHLPGRDPQVTQLLNAYVGQPWPRQVNMNCLVVHKMNVDVDKLNRYGEAFLHLGLSYDGYCQMLEQIVEMENALDNLNQKPMKLLALPQQRASFDASKRAMLIEMRKSFAYHINQRFDAMGIYLHVDFTYPVRKYQVDGMSFFLPECEEQKQIWRAAFWREPPAEGFPLHPECLKFLLGRPAPALAPTPAPTRTQSRHSEVPVANLLNL